MAVSLIAQYLGETTGSGATSHTVSGVAVQTNDIILVVTGSGALSANPTDNDAGGSNTYTALTQYGDVANSRGVMRGYWARAKATNAGLTLTMTHPFNPYGSAVLVIRGAPTSGSPIASETGGFGAFDSPFTINGPSVAASCLAVAAFFITYASTTSISISNGTPLTHIVNSGGASAVMGRVSTKVYASSQAGETWTATANTADYLEGALYYIADAAATVTHSIGAGTMAAVAHKGLSQSGLASKRKYWRVPSNATPGATARMVVFNSGSPANAVAQEGAVTADSAGNFDLPSSDAAADQTKRFALVHNWNGATGTTSIFGGPAIATMNEVNA